MRELEKCLQIIYVFAKNTSDSVNAIKSLISETPDLKPLKSYGVDIKEQRWKYLLRWDNCHYFL